MWWLHSLQTNLWVLPIVSSGLRRGGLGFRPMRALLHEFYEGDTPRPALRGSALFAFDLATLAFVVATSFVDRDRAVELDRT